LWTRASLERVLERRLKNLAITGRGPWHPWTPDLLGREAFGGSTERWFSVVKSWKRFYNNFPYS